MDGFVEKLIERLEEASYNHFDLKLSTAIEIVTQLAEEYKSTDYEKGYAEGWHDCASTIQQSAPYQPKGE